MNGCILAHSIPKGELLLSFDWINGERIFTLLGFINNALDNFLFVRGWFLHFNTLAHQADFLERGDSQDNWKKRL